MKKNWIAAVAIALVLAVPVGFKLFRGDAVKEVEVERATQRLISPFILASGTLIYKSQVTLVSEVIGRVDQLLVNEGDIVTKGQMLLRLDGEASRAEIAQLQASRRQAELNVERARVNRDAAAAKMRRYEALRANGLIEATKYDELVTQEQVTEVELRTSKEAVKQAEAQLHQSQQRLGKTEIRAPIDGKVTSLSIKLGETAVPSAVSIAGSNLMVISDTRHTFAEINVDEADIGRIAVGQEAKVVPAAFPDRSLHGKVEQLAMAPRQAGTGQGQSRAYAVKIRLAASELVFHPGMSCRAEIATGKTGGVKNLGVPVQAVQYEEADRKTGKSRASVFVLELGKAVKRDVEPGVADDNHIEILRGLKKDETVIVGPPKTLRFLRDGEAIVGKSGTSDTTAVNPL
jgi:HlyD family secretion protein